MHWPSLAADIKGVRGGFQGGEAWWNEQAEGSGRETRKEREKKV